MWISSICMCENMFPLGRKGTSWRKSEQWLSTFLVLIEISLSLWTRQLMSACSLSQSFQLSSCVCCVCWHCYLLKASTGPCEFFWSTSSPLKSPSGWDSPWIPFKGKCSNRCRFSLQCYHLYYHCGYATEILCNSSLCHHGIYFHQVWHSKLKMASYYS